MKFREMTMPETRETVQTNGLTIPQSVLLRADEVIQQGQLEGPLLAVQRSSVIDP